MYEVNTIYNLPTSAVNFKAEFKELQGNYLRFFKSYNNDAVFVIWIITWIIRSFQFCASNSDFLITTCFYNCKNKSS